MNTVAPVWDGNETWLILGGGGLFGVFPLAYATIMPAVYMPIIIMLLALIFRGVAFEMRFRAATPGQLLWWDRSFSGGSYVATFAQGVVLGALVQGIEVEGRAYAGGWWDWLSPFSVLTGVALMAGYGMLGACWLVWKTEGEMQDQVRALARRMTVLTLGFIGLVSLVVPFLLPAFRARWFDFPAILAALPVPVLVVVLTWRLLRGLAEAGTHPRQPPRGLARRHPLRLCPGAVLPGLYRAWHFHVADDRAAGHHDLGGGLAAIVAAVHAGGAAVLIPVILAYTAYVYWLFRGKIKAGQGYH